MQKTNEYIQYWSVFSKDDIFVSMEKKIEELHTNTMPPSISRIPFNKEITFGIWQIFL